MVRGRLIGIGGLLYAGKDAVSDHLVDKHDWVKLGMSDPLNDALLAINPYIPINVREGDLREHLNGEFVPYTRLYEELGYVESKLNGEVRRLLQALGTEVGRNMIGENVWIDIAVRRFEALRDQGYDVIVTGMRFPNELDAITDSGGQLWWVSRPGVGGGSGGAGVHASENSVSPHDFDVVIPNVGDLDDLYLQTELALSRI